MNKREHGFGLFEVLAGVVAVVAVGLIGIFILKAENTNHFKDLAAKTNAYYSEQAKALGFQASDGDLNKTCYRAEQTDIDNGNIWCGIDIYEKKITIQPTEEQLSRLVSNYETAAKKESFSMSFSGHRDNLLMPWGFSYDGKLKDQPSGGICTTRINYSPSAAYADAKTTLIYSLSCDKRSSGILPGYRDETKNP